MFKKFGIVGFLLCFFGATVMAQSAQTIDIIIGMESITNAQACYMAGIVKGAFDEKSSYTQAFDYFSDSGMFKGVQADDYIRFDTFANIVLQNSSKKGGLWFSLTKSSHYAFRALKKKSVISFQTPPSKTVSGREALRIFSVMTESNESAFESAFDDVGKGE